MADNKDFDRGVIYACARLVEMFDEPTMAQNILEESGVDVSVGDKYDLDFFKEPSP